VSQSVDRVVRGKLIKRLLGRRFATWSAATLVAVLATPLLAGAVWLGFDLNPRGAFNGFRRGAVFDYGRGHLGTVPPLRAGFIQSVLGNLIGFPSSSRDLAFGKLGAGGRGAVGLERIVDVHTLVNDHLAEARAISSVPYTGRSTTSGATRTSEDPAQCGSAGGTVWYTYQPPEDALLSAYTFGTDHAVSLGIFTRSGNDLTNHGCDTDSAGNASLSIRARSGVRYYFQIAAPAGGGRLVFNLDPHGSFTRASVGRSGERPNGDSPSLSAISADGRFVAFRSWATNLVDDGPKAPCNTRDFYDQPPYQTCGHIYVRDMDRGTTQLVSKSSSGELANRPSGHPELTAEGRFVLFESWATNLVPGPDRGNLFVHDRIRGTTEGIPSGACLASTSRSFGERAPEEVEQHLEQSWCGMASITDNGRYVAFQSNDSTLVPDDTNLSQDVFVYDRWTGHHERANLDHLGREAPRSEDVQPGSGLGFYYDETIPSLNPYISGDGRYVVFKSEAALVPEDKNEKSDTYLRDRLAGTIERVSVSSRGEEGNGETFTPPGGHPTISTDGRFVVFASTASNLAPGDDDGTVEDVFVRDRVAKTTVMVSDGFVSAGSSGEVPGYPSISGDGRFVVFESNKFLLPSEPGYELVDVFRFDLLTRTTSIVSLSPSGEESWGVWARISRDGRSVVFNSGAGNLDGDTACPAGGFHPTRCRSIFVYRAPDAPHG
jgi:Tol biopolymer transport system component